jgi:autotransporter translocation and assembly factor TamB
MRWEILNESDITLAEDEIHIAKFSLKRNNQYINLDGCLSRNDADKLNFKINDIDLTELAKFIGAPIEMKGMVNGWGYLSDPFEDLNYMGDASIKGLYLNNQEVGDVFVQSNWNNKSESIQLIGDLLYKGNETFAFDGSYYLEREKNNLDFNLVFDKTNIQFANAFMDPLVVNNIRGLVDGKLAVKGSIDEPEVTGKVNLIGGNAKIELLGVNFGFDGAIKSDPYGFYIDNMPVTDEEGNVGALVGAVLHDQFSNWNFDLQFDLEPRAINTNLPYNRQNVPLEKFLVLNTTYKEGDMYFGKAFVTGTANIFGFADNVEITVDVATKKGTTINFPMYGMAELKEDENGNV